jgi:phosphoglycerate dehydrogenase-like enzyme
MMDDLTIWCNQDLTPEAMAALRDGIGDDRLILPSEFTDNLGQRVAPAEWSGNFSAGVKNSELALADIAFGQPDPEMIIWSPNLRWIQITSAGYTRYDRPDVREALEDHDTVFTNSSSVYADPCAQHLLGFMLSETRQLLPAWIDQRGRRTWRHGLRPQMRLLRGENVLIVGYGAIGERLAQLLQPFGAVVTGLRRRVRGDELVSTFGLEHLAEKLPMADHVVNILPAHPTTNHFFGQEAFALLKPGAVFYNMGRGATVDQTALMAALGSGRLAAAYLDVTDPEPLPAEHPLWDAPNCYITPHIGGGFAGEHLHLVRHFLANLARFRAKEPLLDVVF